MATALFTKHNSRPKAEAKQDSGKPDINADFHHACRRGDFHRVRFVLGQCIGNSAAILVDQVDPKTGLSPLSTTILRGHRDLSLYLISLDADVHSTDAAGWTPLHWAIHTGSIELACHLIRSGAKINNPQHPLTCLQLAINEKFGLVDQYIAQQLNQRSNQPTSSLPKSQSAASTPSQGTRALQASGSTANTHHKLSPIQSALSQARTSNNPNDVDALHATISPNFGPKETNLWNFFTLLMQPQACVDFAEKALKDTPLAKEYGETNIDADVDSDGGSVFASDSSDESD